MAFDRSIRPIRNGEPVDAGVANRTPLVNARNIEYLRELIEAASLGSTVYARRVTVESGASVGMPVYFNSSSSTFERAIASASVRESTGVIETSESSQVFGVVALKHNSTLADVLLYGWTDVDLTLATDETASGLYYLSAIDAGRLVRQRPPVSVPVLMRAAGKVFVSPQLVDFIDRHVHYKFYLTCQPAGSVTPPDFGERHTITAADDSLQGWLPADDTSFNSNAPVGAKFGYNLAADAALSGAWPPIPVSGAWLEWNKALDSNVGFTGVPLGETGLVVVDRYGIWWMSDCYGDVPWPIDYTMETSLSESVGECPRDVEMELVLWFAKISMATDSGVVTSLKSLDERIIVKCVDGTVGVAGDLTIDLNLELTIDEADTRGSLALKGISGDKLLRGRITEGIYTTSTNVTLTGEHTALKVPGDEDSETVHMGLVKIDVQASPTRVINVSEVRLDGVEQEFFQDIMYLEFGADEETQYRARIDIPSDLELTAPQVSLRLRIMGSVAGALPQMEVTARIVPRPTDGLVTPMDLPLSGDEFPVTIDTTATLTGTYQYVEATSDPFAVTPGDQVFFTVRRVVDAYAGLVGVLHNECIVSAT